MFWATTRCTFADGDAELGAAFADAVADDDAALGDVLGAVAETDVALVAPAPAPALAPLLVPPQALSSTPRVVAAAAALSSRVEDVITPPSRTTA
jgi:hypothetical protein